MVAASSVRRQSRAPLSETYMPAVRPRSDRPEEKPLLAHQVVLLDVTRVEPHPDNPRDDFEDDDPELVALAESLGQVKLIQPVSVVPAGDAISERYLIVCGERRWRAAILAGWKCIPGFVLSISPEAATRLMVDENLQRKNLNPIETARALLLLRRPKKEGGSGLSAAEASARFKKSDSWGSNMIKLLELPPALQAEVAGGTLEVRAARALAQYSDRPDVVAAVEIDRGQNPADWRGTDAFEASLIRIVQALDGVAAGAADEAQPGDDAGDVAAADVLPLRRRSAPVDHAPIAGHDGEVSARLSDDEVHRIDLVAQIVALLAQLTNPEQLAEVATALEIRAAELLPAATSKKARR